MIIRINETLCPYDKSSDTFHLNDKLLQNILTFQGLRLSLQAGKTCFGSWDEERPDLLSFGEGTWGLGYTVPHSSFFSTKAFETTAIQFREHWTRSCSVINCPKLLMEKMTWGFDLCRGIWAVLWAGSGFFQGLTQPLWSQLLWQRARCWWRGLGRAARPFCSQSQGNNCDFHAWNL